MVNFNCPVFGHYIRDGMAQASPLKTSIRYQVCSSAVDNDIITPSEQGVSSITDDDLCEITISPTTIRKTSLSLTSPNHHTSSLTQSVPIRSTGGHRSSSTDSATLIKSIQPCSSVINPLDRSLSIHSLEKQTNIQHRPSIFGTLATTLTAVRKSSTSIFALAQHQLSNDNGNLFSSYQGNIFERLLDSIKLTC